MTVEILNLRQNELFKFSALPHKKNTSPLLSNIVKTKNTNAIKPQNNVGK